MSRRVAGWVVVAVGLVTAGARADRWPTFTRTRLRCSGLVTGIRVADCDGDGRRDLIVVSDRRVLVFRQRAEGFPEWADDARALPRGTTVMDVWTPPHGGARLVCLDRRGVLVWRFVDGTLAAQAERAVTERTAWRAPPEAPVLVRPLVRDCTGDGRAECLVPVPDGYAIYDLGDGVAAPVRTAHLPVDLGLRVALLEASRGRALYAEAFHPALTVGDADGDGRTDVVVRERGRLRWFCRDAEGRLPAQATRTLDQSTVPRDKPARFNMPFPLTVADVTGDGVLDYIQALPGEGTVLVFAGGPRRTDFRVPDAVIRTPGYALGALPRDLDGDGRLDLLIGTIDRIGLVGALQVFISKSLTVHSLVYYHRDAPAGPPDAADPAGVARFAGTPDDQRTVEVPLAFTTTEDGFQIGTTAIVSFDGDFDGDGRRDALQRVSASALGIWQGRGRRPYGAEPDCLVAIPSPEGYRFVFPEVVELDGDGRSDLILHYRDWEDQQNQVVVFTTGRPK